MTPYSDIYKKFEKNIIDFDLDLLTPTNKAEIELELLQEACIEFTNSPVDLTERNDTTLEFDNTLSDIVQQIIANYMVTSWVKPYLNNQDLMEIHFDTQEVQSYSPAQRLNSLRELSKHARKDADRLANKLTYKNKIGGLR